MQAARRDSQVLAVVRNYLGQRIRDDEQLTYGVVQEIYDYIRRSNSRLARLKRNALEESIERAVETLTLGEIDAGGMDVDDEGEGEEACRQNQGNGTEANPTNRRIRSDEKVDEPESLPDKINKAEAKKTKKRKRGRDPDHTAKLMDHDTGISFEDMGGVGDIIEELTQVMLYPIRKPEVYRAFGLDVAQGILLYGPPGCGKTMLVNAIAARLALPFISISAPSIVSGMSGESEKTLRDYFETATAFAPSILFIDEIDAIMTKRDNAQREMEKRIVAQLLTCMDELNANSPGRKPVIVLAATNRPDSLDPALRRGGRFGREINLPMPTEEVRREILEALTHKIKLGEDVDLVEVARKTPAYVGADLKDLVRLTTEAALMRSLRPLLRYPDPIRDCPELTSRLTEAARRWDQTDLDLLQDFPDLDTLMVRNDDFLQSLPKIIPTAKREGFATIPSTTWEDVGALASVREALDTHIVKPIQNTASWARTGFKAPSGLLLWGPPGCGKTLLAKAVANQTHANFISVKGPELMSKYVGDSERRVREVFTRARSSVPCIVFFDELDAMASKRDDSVNEVSSRVVSTLLVELDGLDSRAGIFVIGATNRPDIIDEAILRPGRFDQLHFVDLPSAEERVDILRTLARPGKPEGYADELADIARGCAGFSGADLSSLISIAAGHAVKREDVVRLEDFQRAREGITPSVKNYSSYKALQKKLSKES